MTPLVTVVAGFPRCGSSLMMRLIAACGIPLLSDADPLSGESPCVLRLPDDSAWFDEAVGRVVKILDIQRHWPPLGFRYRIVWMDRTPIEQAKSQVKILRTARLGLRIASDAAGRISRSLLRDEPAAMRMIGQLIHHPYFDPFNERFMRFSFEELIVSPRPTIKRLCDWLGCGNADALVPLVKKRTPNCLPYVMELEQIAGGVA